MREKLLILAVNHQVNPPKKIWSGVNRVGEVDKQGARMATTRIRSAHWTENFFTSLFCHKTGGNSGGKVCYIPWTCQIRKKLSHLPRQNLTKCRLGMIFAKRISLVMARLKEARNGRSQKMVLTNMQNLRLATLNGRQDSSDACLHRGLWQSKKSRLELSSLVAT